MTNKQMLSFGRKARALLDKPATVEFELWAESGKQLTNHEVCLKEIMQCAYESKPSAQNHPDPVAKYRPVAKLHAERMTGKDGEYGVTVEDSEWFNACILTGGVFNLYAEQSAPVADGTTSDKYKAELYDEVWQLARSMGFNNVTDALTGRVTTGESESECTSCDGSGEYTDAIGDWRGYCTCPAGIEAEEIKGVKP